MSVGVHATHSRVRISEDNMIDTIHVFTKRTPYRGVADLFISKLIIWIVSFCVSGCDWGIGLYGVAGHLPAIVTGASGISRA
eukprot:667738-Pelagomonas_calceolata.AAC.1